MEEESEESEAQQDSKEGNPTYGHEELAMSLMFDAKHVDPGIVEPGINGTAALK